MTNYKELIAEAEKAADSWSQADRPDLLRRLVAAVRELAPPEGWQIDSFKSADGERVIFRGAVAWHEDELRDDDGMLLSFPTASAAMAALDGEQKP